MTCSSAIRKRQHAHHLGEVSVGSRPGEQATEKITVLIGVLAKPRSCASAGPERVQLQDHRLEKAPGLSTLASYDEIGQIVHAYGLYRGLHTSMAILGAEILDAEGHPLSEREGFGVVTRDDGSFAAREEISLPSGKRTAT